MRMILERVIAVANTIKNLVLVSALIALFFAISKDLTDIWPAGNYHNLHYRTKNMQLYAC